MAVKTCYSIVGPVGCWDMVTEGTKAMLFENGVQRKNTRWVYFLFSPHSRQIPYSTVMELSKVNPSCSFNSPATRPMAGLCT